MSRDRGLEILEKRIGEVPQWLRQTLSDPFPKQCLSPEVQQVVTTGIGSSEAAARYLTALLNKTQSVASEYLPSSSFYGELPPSTTGKHLVVFTQGLSSNAQIALERRDQFAGVTLVTSSTPEGQTKSGKTDRATLLQALDREGVSIVTHPMEDEYEILPRIIGPICSLLAAWKIAQSLEGEDSTSQMERSLESAWAIDLPDDDVLHQCAEELILGTDFYFTNSTYLYAQNLPAKVLETAFCPPPRIRDVLDYSHGPFQAERATPGHRWIFTSEEPAEADLLAHLQPLLERVNRPTIIKSPFPEPFAIFYYERFLNAVVLCAAKLAGHNLIDWPGKSEDGEGYSLQHPYRPRTEPIQGT